MNRRLHTTTSGVLLGAVPVPWAVASWVHEGTVLEAPLWVRILLTAATLALAVAGLVIGRFPRTGRGLATFGAAAAMAIALPSLERSPALTVVLGTAAAVGLAALWKIGAPLFFSTSRGFLAPGRVRGSAGVALGFLALWGARAVRLARARSTRRLLQEAEDQAEAAYLLICGQLGKTTGQILSVDGGLHEAFLR